MGDIPGKGRCVSVMEIVANILHFRKKKHPFVSSLLSASLWSIHEKSEDAEDSYFASLRRDVKGMHFPLND